MKNKKLETLLYSAIGVAVMFVIILAVNAIVGTFRARIDMTQDKLHTLDPGTKAILKKLDSPVEIRFYCSRSETRMPSFLKTYATHVEDLLGDIKQASKGKIEIKRLDPKPDSEAEDMANLDGIEAQPIQMTGEQFYLGLAISLDPVKVALPILTPDREKLLEYDIARAIAQVISTVKPVVGVMTALPMFGMPANPMMARMGQQPQGQDPWVFLGELKRDFDVRQIPMETEKIDDDVKVLLVVHPKDIKDTAQYAIDQFVLRGGKLVAFVDPMCLADMERQQQNPMMGMMPSGSSNLDKLFKAWGLTFDTSKVVADMNYARQLPSRSGQPQVVPTYLFLDRSGIDQKDVVAAQLDEILMPCAGVFSGTPATGLKQSVLLKTSDRSQLVEGFMANMAPQKIADDFKASGTSYPLALRLSGKFKTAFPDGKPAAEAKTEEGADKKEEKKDAKPEDSLKESKTDNVVTLVGDVDFIYDRFCARVQNLPFFNQKIVVPQFGNLTLAQAMVEQLAGDSNLIGTRSRASLNRPFLKVKEMQAEANERFQETIKKLEAEQQDAQTKLNELQAKKEPGQRFIMSKEQQDAITKFKQQESEARKRLKEVRKDLRREIDSLETRLKWANIAGMPLLVTITGLCLALIRRQRTKAQ